MVDRAWIGSSQAGVGWLAGHTLNVTLAPTARAHRRHGYGPSASVMKWPDTFVNRPASAGRDVSHTCTLKAWVYPYQMFFVTVMPRPTPWSVRTRSTTPSWLGNPESVNVAQLCWSTVCGASARHSSARSSTPGSTPAR